MNPCFSPDRIEDRFEIQEQILRFSRGVDRKDWDLALSAYHEDGYDYHGIFDGSAASFIEFLKSRHETISMSMHYLPQSLIEFLDHDSALVETYVIGWQKLHANNKDIRALMSAQGETSDMPIEVIAACRYIDLFTRKGGRWAIQERHVIYESGMKITPDARGPDVGSTIERGHRDARDLVYQLRKKLSNS